MLDAEQDQISGTYGVRLRRATLGVMVKDPDDHAVLLVQR